MQLYFVPASLKLHRRHMGCGGSGSVAPSSVLFLAHAGHCARRQTFSTHDLPWDLNCLHFDCAFMYLAWTAVYKGNKKFPRKGQKIEYLSNRWTKMGSVCLCQEHFWNRGSFLGELLVSLILFTSLSVTEEEGSLIINHDQEAGKRKKLLCDQLLWWHMIWMVLNCVLFVLETLSISRQVSAASEQKVCKHGWPPCQSWR